MAPQLSDSLAERLLTEARRINAPEFALSDPVQFPRMYSDLRDIEVTALLTSNIAWGRRDMICRDCRRLLDLMGGEPYRFTVSGAFEDVADSLNIHRTFFGRHLKHYLRGLRLVMSRYGSVDAMSAAVGAGASDAPSWTLAEALRGAMAEANGCGADSRCIPSGLATTALKRLNMALRWLVRDDGIVDLGVWRSITPAQLFIPLDVHVGNTSRRLGLTSRRANDRRTAVEITEALRIVSPADPVLLDFALFGLGIEGGADLH